MIENPYKTSEPFLWAGPYLLYRGKVIGFVGRNGRDTNNFSPWSSYFFMGPTQGVLLTDPAEHSTGAYQSSVMSDLEKWLGNMISRHQDLLDKFLKP